ncbi:DUF2147 domain-containing protein [Phaeodactylibacter sp.]|uniref:DUF2147 domain-containing protein n=1 Tax=Phaeodactylibacter sp. TaxID=1940289 RepID=UPI0025F96261|nr:DUF2147 domain-containing protein [Phaeodactylibacter sp.]MCI4647143.1 DUF2147 domain-containing protein [Phaeodactylibacter sp.]MCI5090869.1 DUF2147 domain-containing protein [Phaeodactylibacter sp.]
MERRLHQQNLLLGWDRLRAGIFILGVFITLLLPVTAHGQQKPSDIVGKWLTQDGKAKVEFYKADDKYFGRIVWLVKPLDERGLPVLDIHNKRASLRSRPLMKLAIINGLEFKNGKWVNGTLYDPVDGSTYGCSVWLEQENTMKLRGYLGLLYETETWTRVTKN